MRKMKIQWDVLAVEGIAIVLSILLAFSIDAWWSNYQDRRKGADYAERVQSELEDIRELVHLHLRSVKRSIEAGRSVETYFSARNRDLPASLLVNSLYNMGRDTFLTFDTTTFDDLISTGQFVLVADPDTRAAIRRAYQRTSDAELDLWPYRDEYLKGVRAWIPQAVVDNIRTACPDQTLPEPEYRCELAEIDESVANSIVARLGNDEAELAFRLREHGLFSTELSLTNALLEVEVAIARFDQL